MKESIHIPTFIIFIRVYTEILNAPLPADTKNLYKSRGFPNISILRSEADIFIEFIRVYLSLHIAMYILNINILRLLKFFVIYLVLSKSLCTFMCKL